MGRMVQVFWDCPSCGMIHTKVVDKNFNCFVFGCVETFRFGNRLMVERADYVVRLDPIVCLTCMRSYQICKFHSKYVVTK